MGKASSRGPFYMFVGSLGLGQWDAQDVQTSLFGFLLMVLGLVTIIAGIIAGRKLDGLRAKFASREDAKKKFHKMDKDNSKSLDRNELKQLVKELGGVDGSEMTEKELEAAVNALDSDRSGKVTWDEFQQWF